MDHAPREPLSGQALVGRLVMFVFLAAGLTWVIGLALPPSGEVVGALALTAGGALAGLALLARDGWPWGALGWTLDGRAAIEAVSGGGLGIAVAGVAMGLMALTGGLRWVPDGAEFSLGAWAIEGGRSLAWLALPALAEEIVLRGYILGATARVFGPAPALWGTSVLFGILHVSNPGAGGLAIVGVTMAGLFLGALVLRSGSVWPAVGAHLGWNWALAFLGDVPVSGLEIADAPGFEGVPGPDVWLSGGLFGVEASVMAVLVLAGVAWIVWRRGDLPRAQGRPEVMWREGIH